MAVKLTNEAVYSEKICKIDDIYSMISDNHI